MQKLVQNIVQCGVHTIPTCMRKFVTLIASVPVKTSTNSPAKQQLSIFYVFVCALLCAKIGDTITM